jgi:hypothetical protein
MKLKLLLTIFCLFPCFAFAQSWILVYADGDSKIHVNKVSVTKVGRFLSASDRISMSQFNTIINSTSLYNCADREISSQVMLVTMPDGSVQDWSSKEKSWTYVQDGEKAAALSFNYVCMLGKKLK